VEDLADEESEEYYETCMACKAKAEHCEEGQLLPSILTAGDGAPKPARFMTTVPPPLLKVPAATYHGFAASRILLYSLGQLYNVRHPSQKPAQ